MRRWRPRYGELGNEQKRRANLRSHTNVLVRRGVIERRPCACGAKAQARHLDWKDPRAVVWACRKCFTGNIGG